MLPLQFLVAEAQRKAEEAAALEAKREAEAAAAAKKGKEAEPPAEEEEVVEEGPRYLGGVVHNFGDIS